MNGLAKELPAVNGMSKEDPPPPQPPRLLTLPTVLTIGRVAAVPLLISSELKTLFPYQLLLTPVCFCWSGYHVL